MDLGEKIRQLDEQVATAVRRALDDVRNELRSGLDQAIEDLRGKLAEVSPELPESFFTEEALRQLAEESAPPSDDALEEACAEAGIKARDEQGTDLVQALAAVDKARSQNDILQALVDQATRFASRAAVLLLRPEGLVGWVAQGFEGAPDAIRSASILAQAEDWSSIVQGGASRRLGPSRCAQLVSQLDSPLPTDGVAIPVLLRDRISAIFYADRVAATGRLDVAALQALTYTTALALETLTFRERESTATLESVVGAVPAAAEPEPELFVAPSEGDEEIELAEEAPEPVVEESPEPPTPIEAPAEVPIEAETEPEEPEVYELETPDLEEAPAQAEPADEEPTVIELPEDVGEMELETEEDQTESWRSWKAPEPEPDPDSLLEVVDLDADSGSPETATPEVEVEEVEVEPPSTVSAAPPAAEPASPDEAPEAPTGTETRTIAGFDSEIDLDRAAEPTTGPEPVELDVDELELDADSLGELPELETGPAEEPEVELEVEEEPAEEPVAWRTEEPEPSAAGTPVTEAAPPEAPATPEPPSPAPSAPAEEPPAAEPAPAAAEASEPPASTSAGAFPADTPDLPSGGPIEPPTDVSGPGLAFAEGGTSEAASGDDAAHQEARRLARLLVSEIQLYNQEEVEEGRRNGDIYERLKDDIDRSRQLYEERVAPDLRESTDYFYQELVRQLGAGDAKALGI